MALYLSPCPSHMTTYPGEVCDKCAFIDRDPRTPVERAVDVLNELLELDRVAISNLFKAESAVGEALAEHPTAQVGPSQSGEHDGYVLRPLGLINALYGARQDGWGHICSLTSLSDGTIQEFRLLAADGGDGKPVYRNMSIFGIEDAPVPMSGEEND